MDPRVSFAAVAILAAVVPGAARADCAAPTDYWIKVSGNTVTISPMSFEGRTCPDAQGMLRQDSATREVVRLADFCAAKDAGATASYVDECVPAGDYHYGYAKPFDCSPNSCGTYFFQNATVTTAPSPTCQRSPGNAGPTAVASAPWSSVREICGYQGGNEAGIPHDAAPSSGADAEPVAPHRDAHVAGLVLDADLPTTRTDADLAAARTNPKSGGCSTAPHTATTVLAFDGLVLAAGLMALRRSRRPRA